MKDEVLPRNLDAERVVLAGLLRDNGRIDEVSLLPEHFYSAAHAEVAQAIFALNQLGQPADLVTVAEWLVRHKNQPGIAPLLAEIWDATGTAESLTHHAQIVLDNWRLRQLIMAGRRIEEEARHSGASAADLADQAEQELARIGAASQRLPQKIDTYLRSARTALESRCDGKHSAGLPFGFSALDEATGGARAGELTVVAARTSVGKTSLAIGFARNVAVNSRAETPVYIASLEMTGEELAARMLIQHLRIDSHRWRAGKLTQDEWASLSAQVHEIEQAPVWIDETQVSIRRICSNARLLRNRHQIGLVIVDYLQLVQAEDRREQRYRQIGEITGRLKLLAKELGVPVIVLAQLARRTEDRADGEPTLADLRESGDIENDVDNALLLYRPKSASASDVVVCKIAKQRNGPTGYVRLEFAKHCMRFDDVIPTEF